jgi:Lysozyme like domain/Bacterial TSP3 repeat
MPVLSIREIYEAARDAGFTPHQAVTWTAIAMAESRGRTGALNDKGEHSVGLWQINVASDVRKNKWGELTDPENNARAAYEISRQGRDMRPWTTTHDRNKGTGADYRTYLDEVEAEIGVKGDPRGVTGYGAPLPEPLPESSYDSIDAGRPLAEPKPDTEPVTNVDTDADGLTDSFEKLIGTKAKLADSDADGFSDSHEVLVARTDPLAAGNRINDKDSDGLSDVTEKVMGTRVTDADTDNDSLADAVEVALGTDPRRIDSDGDGVTDAAESGASGAYDIDPGAPMGANADADGDGLTDTFERLSGTLATQVDTDADRVPDGLEAALGTNPLLGDTDLDGIADGAEVEFGSDPLARGPALGSPPAAAEPAVVGAGPGGQPGGVFDPN